VAGLWIDVGLVVDAQFGRVDSGGDGEFVHRDFVRVGAGAFAGSTHPKRHGYIEFRESVCGLAIGPGVEHARRNRGLLGELLDRRGLLDDLVADGGDGESRSRPIPHRLWDSSVFAYIDKNLPRR
jgi:hypothetical protein